MWHVVQIFFEVIGALVTIFFAVSFFAVSQQRRRIARDAREEHRPSEPA